MESTKPTSNEAENGNELKPLLVAVFSFFRKIFTHNYCDTCGFTKDEVYVTEHFTEAGIIECKKCYGSRNCH
ncbi:hypothetical protein [Flavobacterium psychrophilum]|uniref:Uncharacterized protein n=1 Tax=Flavobacterium psychrophilum TaxID=96345 RepID=A0A7U2R903_FLAPS|nr:hypothetical protein [Flavobacterium psychrophilum]QRE03483.1 hypothetical protein H0H26_11420 [Flavobacterium psychrophilum]